MNELTASLNYDCVVCADLVVLLLHVCHCVEVLLDEIVLCMSADVYMPYIYRNDMARKLEDKVLALCSWRSVCNSIV